MHDPELEYQTKISETVDDHELAELSDIVFVEVTDGDHSDSESRVEVHGQIHHDRYRVLAATGASVPNTLTSPALDIRDHTGVRPHFYFEWTEGNPLVQLLRCSASARSHR